jgi:hypothetical protein
MSGLTSLLTPAAARGVEDTPASRSTSLRSQLTLGVAAGTREGRAERELAGALLRVSRAKSRSKTRADLGQTTLTFSEPVIERDAENLTVAEPLAEKQREPLEILQRWDGVVIAVGGETFRARLFDRSTATPEIEADVYISDVATQDRDLLRPNAVFYWHMGYRDPAGDRERVSKIRFQRLPAKTEMDIARARSRADARRKRHNWK